MVLPRLNHFPRENIYLALLLAKFLSLLQVISRQGSSFIGHPSSLNAMALSAADLQVNPSFILRLSCPLGLLF